MLVVINIYHLSPVAGLSTGRQQYCSEQLQVRRFDLKAPFTPHFSLEMCGDLWGVETADSLENFGARQQSCICFVCGLIA